MNETRGIAQLVELNAHREEILPPYSEEALALRFADENADKLRYVHSWGRWFQWSGQRWEADETLVAFETARILCRTAATRAEAGALRLASAKTVAAVVTLARADRQIAAVAGEWDADPWLLNTPGGTVDLQTGALRPHCIDDKCTKITAVTPCGECPLWLSTFDYIFAGNAELVSFLQRLGRIRPDWRHSRACAGLLPRHRRQWQERPPEHASRDLWRLRHDGADGVSFLPHGAISTRPAWPASGAPVS